MPPPSRAWVKSSRSLIIRDDRSAEEWIRRAIFVTRSDAQEVLLELGSLLQLLADLLGLVDVGVGSKPFDDLTLAVTRGEGAAQARVVASTSVSTASTGCPSASSTRHPVSSSAAGFRSVTTPSASVARTPSPMLSSVLAQRGDDLPEKPRHEVSELGGSAATRRERGAHARSPLLHQRVELRFEEVGDRRHGWRSHSIDFSIRISRQECVADRPDVAHPPRDRARPPALPSHHGHVRRPLRLHPAPALDRPRALLPGRVRRH